jgi:hypothetical protein
MNTESSLLVHSPLSGKTSLLKHGDHPLATSGKKKLLPLWADGRVISQSVVIFTAVNPSIIKIPIVVLPNESILSGSIGRSRQVCYYFVAGSGQHHVRLPCFCLIASPQCCRLLHSRLEFGILPPLLLLLPP